ncbi:MAG: TIGR03618 family F420-dependent PPOX class oxidoreductase [Dehalococcoidia bacterium]
MSVESLEELLAQNRVVVFVTYRKDGQPQMSLVTVGAYDRGLAFTTRHRNAKFHNLARDPRCAMMLTKPDLRGYAVLDGRAEVRGPHNTEPGQLRMELRNVYRAASGQDHPDWDEYDRVMEEQQRAAILLPPGRTFFRNAP